MNQAEFIPNEYFNPEITTEASTSGLPEPGSLIDHYDESYPYAFNDAGERLEGTIFIETPRIQEWRESSGPDVPDVWRTGYRMDLFFPKEYAYTYSIILPREGSLRARQYVAGEYGTVLSYDGLFVARFYSQTGGAVAHLEPLEVSDQERSQLACIRNERLPSIWNRIVHGC